ncbi:hypothetical protein Tco_0978498 [Tanacetum coccineum]|uniref:Uncharacterized protein n=1 Tax=Tanacetum coccineum TaxID=301880 RepID=A0ABQ5EN09_9ASTR
MVYLIDRSASWILILVGLSLEIPNRWKRECGIRLILAPKSARAFLYSQGSDVYGREGDIGCFLVSPSVKLLVGGCGGVKKGRSRVLIPDLVVMARVGASGSGVLLLSIAERI